LITGAASGIGRETAQLFAERGARLELVDIDEVGLAATAKHCRDLGASVETHIVDVSDAAAMEALAAAIHQRIPALDVLVNNAGIGAAGRFLDSTLQTWRRTFDINVMGVVHGCQAFLPAMVERSKTSGASASVVNVASAAGLSAMADMPVYASSKFAVVGLSESLRADLRRHRINVTCLCPGLIDTPIVKNTRYEGATLSSDAARERIQQVYHRRNYTPRKVAEVLVRAVERRAGLVPVTPESWFIWWAQRISPGLLSRVAANGERLLAKR
jgi:NAD(P)-dependent dehydrogenase (short-subunit alcohol dehydrogenase family)